MKSRLASLALASLLLVSTAISVFAVEVGQQIEKITTKDGKTYHQVVVKKIQPEGVSIMHRDGAATIPAAALPEALARDLKNANNSKLARQPTLVSPVSGPSSDSGRTKKAPTPPSQGGKEAQIPPPKDEVVRYARVATGDNKIIDHYQERTKITDHDGNKIEGPAKEVLMAALARSGHPGGTEGIFFTGADEKKRWMIKGWSLSFLSDTAKTGMLIGMDEIDQRAVLVRGEDLIAQTPSHKARFIRGRFGKGTSLLNAESLEKELAAAGSINRSAVAGASSDHYWISLDGTADLRVHNQFEMALRESGMIGEDEIVFFDGIDGKWNDLLSRKKTSS